MLRWPGSKPALRICGSWIRANATIKTAMVAWMKHVTMKATIVARIQLSALALRWPGFKSRQLIVLAWIHANPAHGRFLGPDQLRALWLDSPGFRHLQCAGLLWIQASSARRWFLDPGGPSANAWDWS